MIELSTKIIINAGVSETWRVFSRFSDYPAWNPFIKAIKGNVAVGNRIEVLLHQPGRNPMKMNPKVIYFEKEKELRWLGHLILPGLFDGEHVFQLEQNDNGSTTFIQKEIFKGLLVLLFRKMLNVDTRLGFEMMNKKLKERVENKKGNP